MSRVDKALRVWEDAAGGARSLEEKAPSAEPTSIHDYVPESTSVRQTTPSAAPTLAAPLAPEPLPPPASARIVQARRNTPRARPPATDYESAARLVTGTPSAVSLEQYRRLAASLHEAQQETGLKSVMLTSALPNEGKTLTTINLGLTLSESYDRSVLIIDADLRRPGVHSVLGIANTRGLVESLSGDHQEPSFVAVSPRLSVLTAGQTGASPLAQLSSPRMGVLLEECSRQFDWVLVDTPPVGILSDAHVLARLVGAVILVIRAGSTPAGVIERTVAELGPECIIGTVLNRVERHILTEADYYDRYDSRQ